jgi:F0F1-type ATP synthase membrane subunit b/b'
LVVLVVLCLCPEAQASAGEGEHGPNWGMLALQALNILILLFVLVRFARKPIGHFLSQRSHGIRSQIEAAESRLREVRAELEQLRGRLERFAEAAELAAKLAEELLRESLGPDDDRRLVSEYIERVRGSQ